MMLNNGASALSPFVDKENCLNGLADLLALFQARGIGLTSVKGWCPGC